ncbi:hypothetical protein [Dyella mobilis]|uniref:Uncharacterized protein n=1 Tax=Dyella mobilis TaxID=1849582 RepID=A0ABS2KEE4_9GAMM|nr:hypothetical protein [Dyella mobilis]MBM7129547.1 hypothetical protein [Dyella mobilis]GLQ98189.1 hypothetical protein GCM10007863_26090 [Dyella mobilis]
MPKTMAPERVREFDELSHYVDFFATHLWNIDPASPSHPAHSLTTIIQKYGMSRALQGLRQAVNGTLESTAHLPIASLLELDSRFGSAGIISISEMRRRYSARYRHVVKRGKIRNDTEYYLVNGILADAAIQMTDEQRALLQKLLDAYEDSTSNSP